MKQRLCPKCGKNDMRTTDSHSSASIQVTALRGAYLKYYVCIWCGYVESYVADEKQLKRIAEKWKA